MVCPIHVFRAALRPVHDLVTAADGAALDAGSAAGVVEAAGQFFALDTDPEFSEILRNFGWIAEEDNQLMEGQLDAESVTGLAGMLEMMLESRAPYATGEGGAVGHGDDGNSRIKKQSDEGPTATAEEATFAYDEPRVEIVPAPLQGQLRKLTRELIGGRRGNGFAGAQPVSLDMDNLQYLVDAQYWVFLAWA